MIYTYKLYLIEKLNFRNERRIENKSYNKIYVVNDEFTSSFNHWQHIFYNIIFLVKYIFVLNLIIIYNKFLIFCLFIEGGSYENK